MGDIKVELFQDKAPLTVANFLKYVDEKFYDKTIFHRVITNFMVQCGGFDTDNEEKEAHPEIKDEVNTGLQNIRGTLSMANKGPNTGSSQFFINMKHNSHLDGKHAVFGKVLDGMTVVEKISRVETGKQKFKVPSPDGSGKLVSTTFTDVPVEPVIIKSIKRIDK
jgi:cyclophilin family peptidyl-prolyl cis-trans isomerase